MALGWMVFFSIYQGHLFFPKATYVGPVLGKRGGLFGGGSQVWSMASPEPPVVRLSWSQLFLFFLFLFFGRARGGGGWAEFPFKMNKSPFVPMVVEGLGGV